MDSPIDVKQLLVERLGMFLDGRVDLCLERMDVAVHRMADFSSVIT